MAPLVCAAGAVELWPRATVSTVPAAEVATITSSSILMRIGKTVPNGASDPTVSDVTALSIVALSGVPFDTWSDCTPMRTRVAEPALVTDAATDAS